MKTWLITRHQGTIDWFYLQGIVVDEVAHHICVDDVKSSDRVFGVLPVNIQAQLCEKGVECWNISMNIPVHLRGAELDVTTVTELSPVLEYFEIVRVPKKTWQ